MRWTTYDGTPDTLPPIGLEVIVDSASCGERIAVTRDGDDWFEDGVGSLKVTEGDSWLPIPTPAQCEAWEKAKEALQRDGMPARMVDDMQMVRALLRHIWQQFDSGGESMGRSLRSMALETAMGLLDRNVIKDSALFKTHDESPRAFVLAAREALAAIEAAETNNQKENAK